MSACLKRRRRPWFGMNEVHCIFRWAQVHLGFVCYKVDGKDKENGATSYIDLIIFFILNNIKKEDIFDNNKDKDKEKVNGTYW